MNLFRHTKLLPHEWIFGAFLLITWARLLMVAGIGDPDALLYSGILFLNIVVIGYCRLRETKWSWWVRLWFYVVIVNVIFMNMKSSVIKVSSWKFDTVLADWDRRWFGAMLSQHAERIATPILTEILSFCYLLFFPYLLISVCYYTYRGVSWMKQLSIGLFSIYGLGFIGYSWLPAAGPHLPFGDKFSEPLTGWAITKFNAYIVEKGSNGVDVFPSLHCAVSAYLLFFDHLHCPRRFRLYLPPCLGIWLATIYLRYHYAFDLMAGFALAALALCLTKRWARISNIYQDHDSYISL